MGLLYMSSTKGSVRKLCTWKKMNSDIAFDNSPEQPAKC